MNGPWRVPSGSMQYQVGSGARAGSGRVPGSHASRTGSGASGTAASTTTDGTRSVDGGGGGGSGSGGGLGTLGAEPHATADVKNQATAQRRTTALLCTN